MKLGAVFPTNEIGTDPDTIRHYVTTVERMGFDFLVVYDHILGADISQRPDWTGPFNSVHMFHEPLVLLGYLAAITTRIEFFTSMLVLPQRQAALVAKQAAEVDVLTRGRLRFGAGLGWNAVEFEALGQDFNTRGERCEEQIALLRELWTKPSVTFRGRWHSVTAAGLNPLPVQRPIPIWVGGALEVVLKHVGRMADGWVMPACDPRQEDAKAMPGRFRRHISEQGHKDSRTVGIEARVTLQTDPLEECIQRTHRWRELDATHTGINTMAYGFTAIDQHLETLHRYLAAVQH